jgi:hypothetical protein
MDEQTMTRPDEKPAASQPIGVTTSQHARRSVDIDKLAEKVYQLMQAELRLERARGVRASQRKQR